MLSVAVSKRARQLSEGAKPLIDTVDTEKPFSPIQVAMKEIEKKLVTISMREEVDDEIELIEKLDKSLDEQLEKKEKEEQVTKKPKEKDGKKGKSKSLATS